MQQPADYDQSANWYPDELADLAELPLDELFTESYDLWKRIETERMEIAVET